MLPRVSVSVASCGLQREAKVLSDEIEKPETQPGPVCPDTVTEPIRPRRLDHRDVNLSPCRWPVLSENS